MVRSKTFLPAAWNFLLCVCLPLLKLLRVFHTIPLTLSHVYFSWSYTSSRLGARDVAPFPRLHLQQAERPELALFLLSFSQLYQKITFVRQRYSQHTRGPWPGRYKSLWRREKPIPTLLLWQNQLFSLGISSQS